MSVYRITYRHSIDGPLHYVTDEDDAGNTTIRECDLELAEITKTHLIQDHGVHPNSINFIEIEDQ